MASTAEAVEPADGIASPSFEAASRFLSQASFGPTERSVAAVRERGFEGWFLDQVALPRQSLLARFQAAPKEERHTVYPLFWEGAVRGEDQLRQRVAYALSRIVVISLQEAQGWPGPFVVYADHLAEQAFGNYGDLLRAVTYAPAMGLYLSHLGNRKADTETGAAPDENYARELMQLFTIGLVPLTPGGEPLPGQTYGPDDVSGLAAIMTGLSWSGLDAFGETRKGKGDPLALRPMDAYPVAHEQGVKRFLGYEAEGPNPIAAIDGALAHLMKHPNTAPFVSLRLIQALTTSNPGAAYVERVGEAFEAGRFALPSGHVVGDGRPGAMTAVIAAILFDEEARSPARLTDPRFGRLREPTLRFAHAIRAFPGPFDPDVPPSSISYLSFSHQQAEFAEQPWNSPSVFGTFGQDYRAAGSGVAAADLVSPEAQVQNVSSTLGYLNRASDLVRTDLPGPMATDFAPLDDAIEEGPDAVVRLVERRFYHGAMPTHSRKGLLAALFRLSGGTNERQRRHYAGRQRQYAVTWAMTDAAFAVQR